MQYEFVATQDETGKLKLSRPSSFFSGAVQSRAGEPAGDTGQPKPATSVYPKEVDVGYEYAPWGWNDQAPNIAYAKIEKVAIAAQTIARMASRLRGNTITYVKTEDLAKTATPDRHYHPDVELFLEENQIVNEWWTPQAMEYWLLWNTFSELKLSLSKKFIVGLYHKEAPFCRLAKQDRNGVIPSLLYDTRFAFGAYYRSQLNRNEKNPDGTRATEIPLLRWWDTQRFFSKLRGWTFAWHSRTRFGRHVYYATPPNKGLMRPKGWLDNAADVPAIVHSLQNNQIRLKYQILVDSEYFRILHPDWDNYGHKSREAVVDKFEDDVNRKLVGTGKLYASIITVYDVDNLSQKAKGTIEIKAIDDKMKSDDWIPGAERANFEIVQGLGGHPTDFGLARENGAMGSGSGSDKREVWNTNILEGNMYKDVLLAPLNFIARYNKWNVRFMVDHTFHTTTNDQEDGMKKNKPNVEPKGEK